MSTDNKKADFQAEEQAVPNAQVEITGRNVTVPEHFAERVNTKLAKIERLDPTLITASGKGHIARAEAKEDSFYAALEVALARMERSLRKVKVRRKTPKSGHRAPVGMGEATAALVEEAKPHQEEKPGKYDVDPYEDQFQPGQVVRSKTHSAKPMSVDEALSEMELVGHDFYLFVNEENSQPSVVYRRHAFDYGLITLKPENN